MSEQILTLRAACPVTASDEILRAPVQRDGTRPPAGARRWGIAGRDRGTRASRRSTRGRRAAWSLAVCTTLCLLIPRPAVASPAGPGSVPDSGVPVPPVAAVAGGGTTAAPVAGTQGGPLGAQILAKKAELEATGERLTKATIDLTNAQQTVTTTSAAWQRATNELADLKLRAGDTASKAYKDATELGPFGDYVNEMHQLGMLAHGLGDGVPGGPAGSQDAALQMVQAQREVDNDLAAYQTAVALAAQRAADVTSLQASRDQQQAALDKLMRDNATELAAAEALQAQQDLALAGQYGAGTAVNGMMANPVALTALAAARTRLGDPYVWGAEGPNTFDCSGLMYWAYHQANYWGLPRVAADQYHATTPVSVTNLLPGDLVFFSTTSKTDWTQISHVGMYVGGGYMIEAPTTGDVVKIAPVWWSAFFGATRVVPAVPAPTNPTPTPTQTTGHPKPTPTPTQTNKPLPRPTGTPKPSTPVPTTTAPSTPPSTPATPTAPTTTASAAPSTAASKAASPSVHPSSTASASG